MSTSPASLPDDEDILREILLRLPPLPSSLPRASLVSKLWRRIVSDPHFLRRFRSHHRTPPLLGFFFVDRGNVHAPSFTNGDVLVFTPTLATPDRIPPSALLLPAAHRRGFAVIWDPVTGRRCSIAFPPEFKKNNLHNIDGAVVRDCSLGAFKLVVLFNNIFDNIAHASVYESESGKWGNIISTLVPSSNSFLRSVMVGSTLCWLLDWTGSLILQFDMNRQSLTVIQMPEANDDDATEDLDLQLLQAEDGGLGFAALSRQRIQLFRRTAIPDGAVRWEL
ncbi:hypothetical protein ACP70R_034523 [Stipagrostis hirtigluma subsp. patula]